MRQIAALADRTGGHRRRGYRHPDPALARAQRTVAVRSPGQLSPDRPLTARSQRDLLHQRLPVQGTGKSGGDSGRGLSD